MFEDFGELNPTALGVGVAFGAIVVFIMSQSATGIFWKILGFGVGIVAGYFIGLKNFS